MWQPRDWNDVKVAIGSLEEAPDLDFKKQVSSNQEISKDIAAMTLLGGVLAYGIEADKQERAVAAPKVLLAGLQEKIRAIVNTTIAPIPAIEFTVLREQQTDADGVLVVTIPRSLLCPHMSHGRFPARANTVTRELTEPEVAALYEQRRSVLQSPGETEILDGFVEPVQEIRSAVGIGAMRLMITPFGHPRHPVGYRLKKPLEQAVADSRPVVDALVKPASPPKAMEWLREWEPRGSSNSPVRSSPHPPPPGWNRQQLRLSPELRTPPTRSRTTHVGAGTGQQSTGPRHALRHLPNLQCRVSTQCVRPRVAPPKAGPLMIRSERLRCLRNPTAATALCRTCGSTGNM